LSSKRELVKENSTVSIAIIDVTDKTTIRKLHTTKDQENGQIICVHEHDLEIYQAKQSSFFERYLEPIRKMKEKLGML